MGTGILSLASEQPSGDALTTSRGNNSMNRLHLFLLLIPGLFCDRAVAQEGAQVAIPPVVRDLGSRRELFVDHFLVERLENVSFKIHKNT